MTVTAGYLRMLLRDQAGPLNEKQRKMIDEADRASARVTALISEMSELGKLEAGEIQIPRVAFDLRSVLTELASTMHEDERGIRLDLRAPAPVMVTGDRTRLAAALKALMHAALRERAEPGVIVVECTTLPDSTPPWAVVAIGDDAIVPSLVEAARGAPPPFDEWRGGLGLALPVGRRVIEAHGGALWSAADTPRAGSGLRLPLYEEHRGS
jgi:signal transduction histidine kinase